MIPHQLRERYSSDARGPPGIPLETAALLFELAKEIRWLLWMREVPEGISRTTRAVPRRDALATPKRLRDIVRYRRSTRT